MMIAEASEPSRDYILLKLTSPEKLPSILPGQFVEVLVEGSPSTFLRRPFSVNFVDRERNQLWILIRAIGDGTRQLAQRAAGETLNVMFPLGNSFTMPTSPTIKPLLVGGGVGTAPMLYLGALLSQMSYSPTFLLGARTSDDLTQLEEFHKYGNVLITTEDGSEGEQGFVTQHSALQHESFGMIYTCGPKPMMQAVARYAQGRAIPCEVSLENKMACGIGACLCCVEDTKAGHKCVCTEGPVFNIEKLQWDV